MGNAKQAMTCQQFRRIWCLKHELLICHNSKDRWCPKGCWVRVNLNHRPAAEPQKCRGTISQIHALTPQEALHRVIGRVKTCIFHMGVKLQWNLRILDFWFRRFVFGKNNQSVDFVQNIILYTLQTTPTRVGVPGCSHFMFVRNTLWCWWFMSLVALRVGLTDYTICGYTDWFTGDAALWLSRWTMHCAGHEDVLCGGHFSSTDT